MKDRIHAENRAQLEAFRRIEGNMAELIDRYAVDFRAIIMSFELAFDRVPTADDLLWIESEQCGFDITKQLY